MDGILNILKPPGMTSFDVVAHLRGLLGIRKIGHAGTLDPLAVGVLPVCIGRATKAIEFMMDKDKIYRAELTLGVKTDTQDSSGNVLSTSDVKCTDEEIDQAVQSFTEKYMQTPPMYSALKVDGKRLYDLAREGMQIERKQREVVIFSSRVLRIDRSDGVRVMLDVHCSKGTYIRTLCADIGERLGCGGYMSFLLRKQAGPFEITSALTLEKLSLMKENGIIQNAFSSVELVFTQLGSFTLNERTEKKFMNGMPVTVPNMTGTEDELIRVYSPANKFVALGYILRGEREIQLRARKFI